MEVLENLARAAFPALEIQPDSLTKEVLALVDQHFPEHPGELKHFAWPVTPTDGRRVLEHFVTHLLPNFGTYQDAMWTEEPFLYHSRLSVALNLKLIHPLQVVKRAEEAYQCGAAPLEAVEGFIRQILGWREYVRGIYWLYMPEYLTKNALNATLPLPKMYWTGDTDYHCLQQAIGQTLKFGYAHHIQRLMVTGLFSLLLGVDPQRVHEWYLAVYVDAVEWVELPNTLGMSQFADGGIMASKPYAATGKYISRMSNYCKTCRYRPEKSTGDDACPFTTLYWEFLLRNEKALLKNQRMSLQMRNLERLSNTEREEIYQHAQRIRLKVLA
ncbi:MAG: cryptochrome/photolyase family protein [Zavarzinella sp.]